MTAATFTLPARWWAWSWKAVGRFTDRTGAQLPLSGVVYGAVDEHGGEGHWQALATDSYRLTVARSVEVGTIDPPEEIATDGDRLSLHDPDGTLDLLAHRILHRTRRNMKQDGVGATVTFRPAKKTADLGLPSVRYLAEWDDVTVSCDSLDISRYPNTDDLWRKHLTAERTAEEMACPVGFDAGFLADYARLPKTPGHLRNPNAVLVKRGGQMDATMWRITGIEWPLWALLMPARVS